MVRTGVLGVGGQLTPHDEVSAHSTSAVYASSGTVNPDAASAIRMLLEEPMKPAAAPLIQATSKVG